MDLTEYGIEVGVKATLQKKKKKIYSEISQLPTIFFLLMYLLDRVFGGKCHTPQKHVTFIAKHPVYMFLNKKCETKSKAGFSPINLLSREPNKNEMALESSEIPPCPPFSKSKFSW